MKNEMVFFGLVLWIIGIAILFANFHEIIKWLGGPENKPAEQPPFIIEERKIQKIRSTHIITSYEAQIFPLDEIKLAVATELLKEMLHVGAIKFEYFDLPSGEKRIEAITYVPEKL